MLWHLHTPGKKCNVPGCDGTNATIRKLLRDLLVDIFFGISWPVVAEGKWMDFGTLMAIYVECHFICGLGAAAMSGGLQSMRRDADRWGLAAEISEGGSFNDSNAKRARTVCRLFEAGILVLKGLCDLVALGPADRLTGWVLRDRRGEAPTKEERELLGGVGCRRGRKHAQRRRHAESQPLAAVA